MDRPAFALVCIVVFAMPWTNMVALGSAGTIGRVVGLVTLAVGAVTVLATGRLRPLKGIHIVIAGFVWWALLSFYWSLDPDVTWERGWRYMTLVVMVWVMWQFSPTVYRTECLMQAFVLGTFVLVAGVFVSRISMGEASGIRFSVPAYNGDHVALDMALGIPLAWHLSMVSRGPGAWVNRLYVPLAVIAVLLTGSRGGAAAATVALLVILWTAGALSLRARIAIALVVAAVVFQTYTLVPSTSLERIVDAPSSIAAGDLAKREKIWGFALSLSSNHAVVGIGTYAFKEVAEPIFGVKMVTHNTYLSILVENGIIGFGLFCTILLGLARLAFGMLPAERKAWLHVGGAWMVGVFFLTCEGEHTTWVLWGLLVASAYAVDGPTVHPVIAQQA